MKNAFLWFGLVAFFSVATAKSDFFSAVRFNMIPDVPEEDYKKLEEIARFLQKRVEEAEAAEEVPEAESDTEPEVQSQSSKNELNPPFDYNLPTVNTESENIQPFAVGPFDPRYYRDFGNADEPTKDSPEEANEKRPQTETAADAETSSITYDQAYSSVRRVPLKGLYDEEGKADVFFTAIVAGCSAAAIVAIIGIGIGFYRLQKNSKAAAEVDYPAYGVTGPNKDVSPTSGDRRLAQSAQMYHYQHQKQQIIAMESMNNKERRSSISDAESEEENEEGDYTVYECPGLASTGEMEVKNPLFQDDQTPASKPPTVESRELPNLISFD